MPNFKPKSGKKIKINKHSIMTLDNKHNQKMTEFNTIDNNTIPNLKKQKRKLKNKLKKNNLSIEKTLDIQDEIKKIKKKITKLKNEKKEYLLENSGLIFNYFEKKKDTAMGKNNKKKILHSFFRKNNDTNQLENDDSKKDNENIVQKYFINIDNTYININNYTNDYELCTKCGGELVHVENEGLLICKKCSTQVKFLIEHEKPSYKEPPKEVCFYAYKRINHFREILAQFQAKETTQIPDEVIKNIKSQIKKERISIENMDNKKAKDILKKLGYNKYYEHIPFIKDKLGIKPPVMSPELEDTLCNLFMEIQKPYSKHCPDNRVNFLNYYYVLYKMCELLDETTFLPFFPMLKDPVKRIEQDEIWKKICKELRWQFIPTI
tara:strand:- start:1441 stop:2577 length:1137 start_codon:yes stop_codon:yes gene_type:complete